MTLKEAKEIFINRGYVPTNDGNNIIYDPDKWRNSVGVISRWLEKQPCEDAISRQAELALADGATNGDMIKAMFPQDIEIFWGGGM